MTRRRLASAALWAVLLAVVVVSVPACGKKGSLEAPPGKKDEYTYPRKYPR